ncbi:biotin/lipoyl-containing protein [Candidatus Phytoplasma fraxini]|uniref:Biotin/lipoyl-containing protein n=1 Tax=Ash yellows phytoplasma TaxID=35780 RepID=A0ABZ2U8G8_ASHYP
MVELRFTDIGEGVNEGEITRIFYEAGHEVNEGVDLIEVETDKATVPISSPIKGKIIKIFVKEGDKVEVGDLLLTIE